MKENMSEKTKVYIICAIAGVIMGLAAYFVMKLSLLNTFLLAACWFFAVRYCIFGQKEWYEVKVFKHHMGLRWAALIFLIIYTLMGIAIFIFEEPEHFGVVALYLPMFVICAIQSVKNGKRVKSSGSGRRLC